MKYHKNLSQEKWNELDLIEQLANVSSEVIRAINWEKRGNNEYSKIAFYRALELLNMTKSDKDNRRRLKEVTRAYEVLVDFFAGDNIYSSNKDSLARYFNQITYLNAVRAGK